MINIFKLKKLSAVLILISSICLFSDPVHVDAHEDLHADSAEKTLSVALYPYVPDMSLFQDTITPEWGKLHLDVNLKFISWDCYSGEPPQDLDVFVFDAIFLHDFMDSLLPLSKDDIENYHDLLSYAIEPCTVNDAVYAVPQLLCADLLYTRKGDFKFNSINNIYELYDILNNLNKLNNKIFISIPDEISLLLWYFQAVIDITGQYTDTFMSLSDDFKNSAFNSLSILKIMSDGHACQTQNSI